MFAFIRNSNLKSGTTHRENRPYWLQRWRLIYQTRKENNVSYVKDDKKWPCPFLTQLYYQQSTRITSFLLSVTSLILSNIERMILIPFSVVVLTAISNFSTCVLVKQKIELFLFHYFRTTLKRPTIWARLQSKLNCVSYVYAYMNLPSRLGL